MNKNVVTSFVAAIFLLATVDACAGELYGRPLRGLSPVALLDIVKEPRRFVNRTIGIAGTVQSARGGILTIAEGGASIELAAAGFALPENAAGARVRAEGRVETREQEAVRFIASGVEFSK